MASWIAQIPTLNERREALKKVPAHLLPIVQTHLRLAWERKKEIARRAAEQCDTAYTPSTKTAPKSTSHSGAAGSGTSRSSAGIGK